MRRSTAAAAGFILTAIGLTAACQKVEPDEADGSAPPGTEQAGKPGHEQYKCYAIQAPPYETLNIDLLSQFSRERVPLGRPSNFCTKVIKIVGERKERREFGTFDGTDLKCYLIQGTDPEKRIRLTTAQFGAETHEVGPAIAACFPANMAFAPNDPPQTLTRDPNYICHLIEGAVPDHGKVDLKTRLFPLEKDVTIDKPYAVCAPAVRNPQGDEEEQERERRRIEGIYPHLKCYGIAGPPVGRMINILTLLNEERNVMVQQPQGFCVAATKDVLGTGEPTPDPTPDPTPEPAPEAGPDVQP